MNEFGMMIAALLTAFKTLNGDNAAQIKKLAVEHFEKAFGKLPQDESEITQQYLINKRGQLFVGVSDYHTCWHKIRDAIVKEGKIPAIKLAREFFGYGLLEAKEIVENYQTAHKLEYGRK